MKGLLMVFTGDGKGKTTAALGTALRAWGHGMRVCVIQFIKARETGEIRAARRLDGFEIIPMGRGFVGNRGRPGKEHVEAARKALEKVREKMASGQYQLIILDEVNNALSLGLVRSKELMDLLRERPDDLHMILTGRGAPPEILEMADLVTEMRDVKHPYQEGIGAQEGIDY